ncbi:MAG: mannose-1-phosphate guanylyltransferase [Bacteroidetes bacterium]|nr:MAG: mannose-1-phosphate guanylyltransferase [Bacteroidota bacterium]
MSTISHPQATPAGQHHSHYVAIMAGGIGSRFWPVSRTRLPKQFLDILGTGQTLLQSTFNRFAAFLPPQNIFVVTHIDYTHLVQQQLPHIDPANILSEPSRKNTAACVAYMAIKLRQKDPNASFIVAPADHLVLDAPAFAAVCQQALSFVAQQPALLTLGITPTYPNTGYGYIQYSQEEGREEGQGRGQEQGQGQNQGQVYPVKTFTEKPSLELAKAFLASGDFLWNAGIFVWKAADILAAFEQHMPEMYDVFAAETAAYNTPGEQDAINRIYPQCVNISIDFGIMEKAQHVFIIPASFGWSDLGTWNSAYDNMAKDQHQNAASQSNLVAFEAEGNLVHTQPEKLVLLQGLQNFVVVDTKDVLMICHRDKEQEIKEYMAEVKKAKGEKYL